MAKERDDAALADYLQRCERYFIPKTLERLGSQSGTIGKVLAISRESLRERMRRLAIAAPDVQDDCSPSKGPRLRLSTDHPLTRATVCKSVRADRGIRMGNLIRDQLGLGVPKL